MSETNKINPLDYESDHRVAYLVAEWKRLTQAEKDAEELVEVDPSMRGLVDKEIAEISQQKENLLKEMERIVGAGETEREWPNESS